MMNDAIDLKLIKNTNEYQHNKAYQDTNVYEFLLNLGDELANNYIENINAELGYEYIDKYDFARYKLILENTKQQTNENAYKQQMSKFYEDKYKELQKGYMKMLSTFQN